MIIARPSFHYGVDSITGGTSAIDCSYTPSRASRARSVSKRMAISFEVEGIRIGDGKLFLIAGPCVIESQEHALFMAEVIKGVARSLTFPFIFKSSYDKANRTSLRSFRGPGLVEGLRILKRVKQEIHLPVLTDVHEAKDVSKVAEVAAILQIPAFLCRQTDLVVAAAMTDRAVNIKKGQFVSPWDMRHVV